MAKTEHEREPVSVGDRPRQDEETEEQRKNRLVKAQQKLEDAKNIYQTLRNLQPGTRHFMDELNSIVRGSGIALEEMHADLLAWATKSLKQKIVDAEDEVTDAGGTVLKPGEIDDKAKQEAIKDQMIRDGADVKVLVDKEDLHKVQTNTKASTPAKKK